MPSTEQHPPTPTDTEIFTPHHSPLGCKRGHLGLPPGLGARSPSLFPPPHATGFSVLSIQRSHSLPSGLWTKFETPGGAPLLDYTCGLHTRMTSIHSSSSKIRFDNSPRSLLSNESVLPLVTSKESSVPRCLFCLLKNLFSFPTLNSCTANLKGISLYDV